MITTTGVLHSSAWQTVLIDDGPPSTKIITIGIGDSSVSSTLFFCVIFLEYFSISARFRRTVSAFFSPSSNNKKCVWFGSKSHCFGGLFLTI